MAVIINELIIKGKINGGDESTEADIVKLIDERTKGATAAKNYLSESERRALINECVEEVMSRLNDRLNY
jgi:hypothetical protein